MSLLDKNKIFFGLLHYIFSEQSNVDWALKTSLVNFTGINSTVDNKKYKQDSITDDVIQYIYDIKPYHVQFEQYIEKYYSQQDDAYVQPSEQENITFYIRYDAVTSEIDEQGTMSDIEYMDTHMANRLYFYKTKDPAIIKDYLNCHFKGITVDGGNMNIDKFGYDAFLYDSSLYDAPTITSEYCLVNLTENLDYPYTKKFVSVGTKSFPLSSDETISKERLEITSTVGNTTKSIVDYSIEDNIVTLFYNTIKFEKIIITYKKEDGTSEGYVFVSHPFVVSDDPNALKQFVNVDQRIFPIPDGNLGSKKVTVHIENMNGSRFLVTTQGYEIVNDEVHVYDPNLGENWKILLTVVDYRYIYDKIYTWEDLYGQANNMTPWLAYYENMNDVQNLDGNKFLRPYYESERPSELCVTQPIHYLMVYNQNSSNKTKTIYNVDYKNYQFNLPITLTTKLVKDLNIGDNEIWVEDSTKLSLPYKDENDILHSSKIIINSEIIEYFDYEIVSSTLTKLKRLNRAADGSYLCVEHKINDIVYNIVPNTELETTIRNQTLSYLIKSKTPNKFIIGGEYSNPQKIEVYKKENIKLLTDILLNSTSFEISSNNIQLPSNIILTTPIENNIELNKDQTLKLKVANMEFLIQITKKLTTYVQIVNYLTKEFERLNIPVKIIQPMDNGIKLKQLMFIANNGQALKISNEIGYPVQELFGLKIQGVNTNVEIIKDGYNGLTINGYEIYWGSDKKTVANMRKSEPEIGTIEDAVNTINASTNVNYFIKAELVDGKISLIPLVNETILIGNLTNENEKYNENNIELLGLNKIEQTMDDYSITENNNIAYENKNPKTEGYLYLNGDKIYYKNIEQTSSGNYKITGFNISKEYIANESYILSKTPELVPSTLYSIDSEDYEYWEEDELDDSPEPAQFKKKKNYVVLNNAPAIGEIVMITNRT